MIETRRADIADILDGIGKGLPSVMREADSYDIALRDDRKKEQQAEDSYAANLLDQIAEAAHAKGNMITRLNRVLELLKDW